MFAGRLTGRRREDRSSGASGHGSLLTVRGGTSDKRSEAKDFMIRSPRKRNGGYVKLRSLFLIAGWLVLVECTLKQPAAVAQTETSGSPKSTATKSASAPGSGTWMRSINNVQLGELRIIPATGYADFELNVTRGAPSFNIGIAVGRMLPKDGQWAYETMEWGELCRITFKFETKRVHVDQVGDHVACGFGYGVTAEGDYTLTSRKRPKLQQR
jgi:hypothetical protein